MNIINNIIVKPFFIVDIKIKRSIITDKIKLNIVVFLKKKFLKVFLFIFLLIICLFTSFFLFFSLNNIV